MLSQTLVIPMCISSLWTWNMLSGHKLTWCTWACFTCNPLIIISPHKLSHTWQSPNLGCFEYGTTCARMAWSWDYLWGELMKIGATCAGTTCVLGVLVTGSLWTLGRLVRGQHVFCEYLSQGGLEHWGELSKGTVVQGRFKVVSWSVYCLHVFSERWNWTACRRGGWKASWGCFTASRRCWKMIRRS